MGWFDWLFSPEDGEKEVWVKVCPMCGSKEVTSRGMISRRALSPNFICKSCGFQSPLFPELPLEEAGKIPDQPSVLVPSRAPIAADHSRLDDGMGRGRIFWLMLVALVLWLILAY
ncbi:MAG: hypothetical protein GF416_08935 [Candidatus Altiarchaeales archaeon]|nr:hypothetical protein [Candidatus Altiarchaeales archaeon]MBD3417242.1 hypothetical protein [Candidatus Altiarchaeales archaeon]